MAEYNTPSEHLDKNGNPLRGAALAARKEKIERQKTSPEEDNQKPKLESIKESVGSSLKSFFGKGGSKIEATPTPEKESGGDANAFLKIIAKNFMSIHLMARDLNVARQNSIKLVKLEGGESTNKADAQFLKADEREAKLESERAKEQESKKPTPEKAAGAKKPKSFMDKIKEQFGISKIIKSFTKYFYLAGIILIVYDLFKESFTEWVGGLWESIKEQFDEFVSDFKKWFSDVVQPIIDKIKEFIQPIINAVKKVVDAISQWFGEKIDLFAKEFPQTFAFIKGVIDKVTEYITKLKEKLKFVTDAYDKANAKLKSVTDAIAEKLGLKKKEEEKPKPNQPTQRLKLDEKGQFVPMTKEEVDAENKRLASKGIPPPVVKPVTTPPATTKPTKLPEKVIPSTQPPSPAAPASPTKTPEQVAPPADKKPEGVGSGGKFSDEGSFVGALKPWAEYVSKVIGGNVPPFAILGQWAGESGTGKSLPADYNYAGIKAGKKFEKGDFVLTEERYTDKQLEAAKKSGEDLERVLGQDDKMKKSGGRLVTVDEWYGKGTWQKTKDEGKNWVQVRSYFAKFKDLKDFADSFAGFIMSPRYAKAREQKTASGFGYEIAKAGYATASAEKYSAKVAAFDSKYSGSQVASASTQVAADQRQQQKPTTPIVVNAPTTNNKVVNNTQVAQAPAPKDTATNLAARAT